MTPEEYESNILKAELKGFRNGIITGAVVVFLVTLIFSIIKSIIS